MMKKLIVTLFLFIPLLTSCTGLPNSKRIPLEKNQNYVLPDSPNYYELQYSDYTVTTSLNEMVDKINNHESFVAYFYGIECHYCSEFKPVFITYICETKYVFNSVVASSNYLEDIYKLLGPLFPKHFTKGNYTGTPYFYFFLDGDLKYAEGLNSTQRTDYNVFKKFMNGYLKEK